MPHGGFADITANHLLEPTGFLTCADNQGTQMFKGVCKLGSILILSFGVPFENTLDLCSPLVELKEVMANSEGSAGMPWFMSATKLTFLTSSCRVERGCLLLVSRCRLTVLVLLH